MIKFNKNRLSSMLMAVFCICAVAPIDAADHLDEGFANPPLQARTRAYWWWLNGNVDKAALTKDLEWMKKIGMGGGLIFDAGCPAGATPTGPTFGSPAWRELFKYAVQEADRLGLELTLSPQSGWNLGGPPVKPEQAAKHITWSESRVTGPATFAEKLPQPPCQDKFYQDERVLAYRVKQAQLKPSNRPSVTSSSDSWSLRPDVVLDGCVDTAWFAQNRITALSAEKPEWLQLDFPEPVALTGIQVAVSKPKFQLFSH